VLFFDEVDALGAKRSEAKLSGGWRLTINQFLQEMDGTEYSNEGILIIAATNAPWDVDPAFRRPGRFDRVLFVAPPDKAGRASILRLMCQGKPVTDIDFEKVAAVTEKFSGADLKALVDRAVEVKLREAMKAGQVKPITTPDLLTAAALARPTTPEWFETGKNYARYANQDGTYDEIMKYLKTK
jgi:SpoVK/Ycf46/Vps4 family AAA+-type ATPase